MTDAHAPDTDDVREHGTSGAVRQVQFVRDMTCFEGAPKRFLVLRTDGGEIDRSPATPAAASSPVPGQTMRIVQRGRFGRPKLVVTADKIAYRVHQPEEQQFLRAACLRFGGNDTGQGMAIARDSTLLETIERRDTAAEFGSDFVQSAAEYLEESFGSGYNSDTGTAMVTHDMWIGLWEIASFEDA